MNVQVYKLSKQYYGLDLNKIKVLLRVDDYDATELKEIYEDAISIVENYIHKDVAYTEVRYQFTTESYNTPITVNKLVIDEGNFSSISGITVDGVSITDYTLKYDSNSAVIYFPNSISGKDINVYFHSGYSDGQLDKTIRRSIYITINDLYDVDRSSYSSGIYKKNDVLERMLAPFRKVFFYNYDNNEFFNYIY